MEITFLGIGGTLLSVDHVTGKECTFDVNFPEEGLNYRIDFKGETLRVNYLVVNCDRFPYKDLLSYHFRLGKHDIFILFCQPSTDAKETVKFIIDGKPVYYEIPGELTIWMEDSGEVASIHTGDDPGELTVTPKEAFILAASNTKHNQELAVSQKKNLRKSGIPVPGLVIIVELAHDLGEPLLDEPAEFLSQIDFLYSCLHNRIPSLLSTCCF